MFDDDCLCSPSYHRHRSAKFTSILHITNSNTAALYIWLLHALSPSNHCPSNRLPVYRRATLPANNHVSFRPLVLSVRHLRFLTAMRNLPRKEKAWTIVLSIGVISSRTSSLAPAPDQRTSHLANSPLIAHWDTHVLPFAQAETVTPVLLRPSSTRPCPPRSLFCADWRRPVLC